MGRLMPAGHFHSFFRRKNESKKEASRPFQVYASHGSLRWAAELASLKHPRPGTLSFTWLWRNLPLIATFFPFLLLLVQHRFARFFNTGPKIPAV